MWSDRYTARAGNAKDKPHELEAWLATTLSQIKVNPRAFRQAVAYAKTNGKFRRSRRFELGQHDISWPGGSILCLTTPAGKQFCVLISSVLAGEPGGNAVAKFVFLISDDPSPTINANKPMVLKIIHDTKTIPPEVGVSSLAIWQALYQDATLGSATREYHKHTKLKCYLLIPYLEGIDLFDVLDHQQEKDYTERLDIALAVITAVTDFHEKMRHAHRDIKPENIKMQVRDKTWRAALLDFEQCMEMTPGKSVGTVKYLPPEMFFAKKDKYPPYTLEGDIYGLGLVLLEILVPSHITQDIIHSPKRRHKTLDKAAIVDHLSSDAKMMNLPLELKIFIAQMLDENKQNRPSLQRVKNAFITVLATTKHAEAAEQLRAEASMRDVSITSPLLDKGTEGDAPTKWCPCFSWW